MAILTMRFGQTASVMLAARRRVLWVIVLSVEVVGPGAAIGPKCTARSEMIRMSRARSRRRQASKVAPSRACRA